MEETKQVEAQSQQTETVIKQTEKVINTIHTGPVDKLKEELESASNKEYAKLIIEHLIKRCEEDKGFGEDVLRKEKSFNGCFSYIRDNAKKKAVGGCACISDETVYEWAEDYYRSESTNRSTKENAQSEAKVHETVAKCPEIEKNAQKTVANVQKTSETAQTGAAKTQRKKGKAPAKRSELAGQMSIFDLMAGD